ncbi:Crp/Fnr family transcriptional regulator [bacterium]|nr:Crp/Fnr family transcriptional regulator [bacterium]MBU1937909.1 Crp/Fnr family transcriptional regulator [bacterium]
MPNTDLDCALCGSRERSVFCKLSNAELKRLQREKTVRYYRRGQIIFYQGDTPSALYCIHSGWVKLYKTTRQGEGTVIRLLGPGDIAAYRALLANEPFAATAETVEPAKICIISKQTFMEFARCQTDFPNQIIAKLASELRESEELWLRSHETVEKRLARFIVWLLEHRSVEDKEDLTVRIRLRRSEMAQAIGTTPETLSRTLKTFMERGIIKQSRTELTVDNLLELKRMAVDIKEAS